MIEKVFLLLGFFIVMLILISLIWQNENGTGFQWLWQRKKKAVIPILLFGLLWGGYVAGKVSACPTYSACPTCSAFYEKEYFGLQQKVDNFLKEHKRVRKYFEN